MVVTGQERARMILTTLNNGMKVETVNFSQNIDWMNQEEILQTMRAVMGKGMDKGKALRKALDNLSTLEFIEKREPQTRKTQAKWEYKISDKGKGWLQQLQDLDSVMKDI